jgi:hypothetical protein
VNRSAVSINVLFWNLIEAKRALRKLCQMSLAHSLMTGAALLLIAAAMAGVLR